MNLNRSNRVIKYVLIAFNVLFVISGIIMLAVGVSVKAYYTDYYTFLNGSYFALPNLLIAIGCLIFFISIFGCCGAMRESWFMIFMFSVLLSIIFILEFSAGIAGYLLRDQTLSYLEEEMRNALKLYQFNVNKTNDDTLMWDIVQSKFECCGVEGPKDWPPFHFPSPTSKSTDDRKSPPGLTKRAAESIDLSASSARDTYYDLPLSCCKVNYGATNAFCNLKDQSTATYFKIGCVESFGDFLKKHAVTMGGVGIVLALILLLGVIFTCHLTKQLRRRFSHIS